MTQTRSIMATLALIGLSATMPLDLQAAPPTTANAPQGVQYGPARPDVREAWTRVASRPTAPRVANNTPAQGAAAATNTNKVPYAAPQHHPGMTQEHGVQGVAPIGPAFDYGTTGYGGRVYGGAGIPPGDYPMGNPPPAGFTPGAGMPGAGMPGMYGGGAAGGYNPAVGGGGGMAGGDGMVGGGSCGAGGAGGAVGGDFGGSTDGWNTNCACRWFVWKSWGNMPQHMPYFPNAHGYYYFRPYNVIHVLQQQEMTHRWGMDTRNPYDNRFFTNIYDQVEGMYNTPAVPVVDEDDSDDLRPKAATMSRPVQIIR